jgi:acetyl-CoA carboxylase carboxyltransferase component
MIAGETSLAYEEIFTISMVSSRTVGIGSYLVRLGQRVIQVDDSPIILTGSQALNKVLGKNVYLSNEQIGGPQIMYNNGVTHLTVPSDAAGIQAILRWLSYVPMTNKSPLPITIPTDPIDRVIDYIPSPQPYDPRWMIAGRVLTDGSFQTGFFDTDSWTETLGGWARGVVCGRARLGGIPVGVIAVETRTLEHIVPADPAEPDTVTHITQQPGQVWFPNSAYKTAQAILDFNKEKLPLIIFANWRGFSGGMRDMFNEVLKYGSYIVDNLRSYNQPVLVYLPPYSELRGGAWVVVDPTINPDRMELYADDNSRGGVLEPEGTVEIKYREKDLLTTMARVDEEYGTLLSQISDKNLSKEDKREIEKKLLLRKKQLLPIYRQVAVQFADLHDTPGRMKAKDVILDVISWRDSRKFFFSRLRRLISEQPFIQKIRSNKPKLSFVEARNILASIFEQDTKEKWNFDEAVYHWFNHSGKSINERIENDHEIPGQIETLTAILTSNPKNTTSLLSGLLQRLSGEQINELKVLINQHPSQRTNK